MTDMARSYFWTLTESFLVDTICELEKIAKQADKCNRLDGYDDSMTLDRAENICVNLTDMTKAIDTIRFASDRACGMYETGDDTPDTVLLKDIKKELNKSGRMDWYNSLTDSTPTYLSNSTINKK